MRPQERRVHSGFHLAGKLSRDPGYFSSDNTVCHGTSSSALMSRHVTGPLNDLLTDAAADGGVVPLPLDPNGIIDNLRSKRYYTTAHTSMNAKTAPTDTEKPTNRDYGEGLSLLVESTNSFGGSPRRGLAQASCLARTGDRRRPFGPEGPRKEGSERFVGVRHSAAWAQRPRKREYQVASGSTIPTDAGHAAAGSANSGNSRSRQRPARVAVAISEGRFDARRIPRSTGVLERQWTPMGLPVRVR